MGAVTAFLAPAFSVVPGHTGSVPSPPLRPGTGRGWETPGSCGRGGPRTHSGIRRGSWEGGVAGEVSVTHMEDACPPFIGALSRPRGLPCPGVRVFLGGSAGC